MDIEALKRAPEIIKFKKQHDAAVNYLTGQVMKAHPNVDPIITKQIISDLLYEETN